MPEEVILVIGAGGQIGKVLLPALEKKYGEDSVYAADVRETVAHSSHFDWLDATNYEALIDVIKNHGITQIYHLAAILSAKGEADPLLTWDINMKTVLNVLEAGRACKLHKIFVPSSIAVFGPSAPSADVPQNCYLDATTVYGMCKIATENWCAYYYNRYGLDVRSLRYPGVVGYQSDPGGGTTDYAVEIFHKAIQEDHYTCFLEKDTFLPMIYMDDVIGATIQLMEAPAQNLTVRSSYNLNAMSFSPEELAAEIKTHLPGFMISYAPDFRQKIAASWPRSIDDTCARRDWNWQPQFDLKTMVADMVSHLTMAKK